LKKKFWNFQAKDDKTGELTLYGPISETSWWGDEVTPKQFHQLGRRRRVRGADDLLDAQAP
jgi:hypothetical protein